MSRHYVGSPDSPRDLLDYVENTVPGAGSPLVSKYDYGLDGLGRRTSVVHTGQAFSTTGGSGDHLFVFGYNSRGELEDANRHQGTSLDPLGSMLSPGEHDYRYDKIGNRTLAGVDSVPDTTYTANSLNQYTATQQPGQSFDYDADGNLAAETAAGPRLLTAVSYRSHGSAGSFFIPLPLTSPDSAGVECRTNGPQDVRLAFSGIRTGTRLVLASTAWRIGLA